jgi:putative hemolysin
MRLGDGGAMSTASVLLTADQQAATAPRYTLLLSTDPTLVEQAQRLRYDVFTSEPGYALTGLTDQRDADRFDEHCDHLLVREDMSGELVGCYRMLPPPAAAAAGGLYTATEFDVSELDGLRPSLVEMGRAVVREDHRNGAVVLLMWAGILAYLDRCGYDPAMSRAARSAVSGTSCCGATRRRIPCGRTGRWCSTAGRSTRSRRRGALTFRP